MSSPHGFRVMAYALAIAACSATSAGAQPRRSELSLDFPFAGAARRDLGYVATREALHPSFGASARVLGRVMRVDRLELHLGARLAATTWRTETLRQATRAFRTTFDPGFVVRGAHGPLSLALTAGPTFALPAIDELYSGVRTARGAHIELALGWGWVRGRSLLGVELAYMHHRLRTATPNALTTTHIVALRLTIGVAPRDSSGHLSAD